MLKECLAILRTILIGSVFIYAAHWELTTSPWGMPPGSSWNF